jgi:hypothetical protein
MKINRKFAVVFADLGEARYAAIFGRAAKRSIKADRAGNSARQPGKSSLQREYEREIYEMSSLFFPFHKEASLL